MSRSVVILQLDMKSEFARTEDAFEIQSGPVEEGNRHPTRAEIQEHYKPAWFGELSLEDIGETEDPSPSAGVNPSKHFLTLLWTRLERGGKDCPVPRTIDKESPIRSFMIGDIVLLDGEAWVCDRFGWSKLDEGEYVYGKMEAEV